MMEVKSVGVKSLFKMGFFFYLAVMLVVGVVGLLFLLFSLITNFSVTALTSSLGAVVVYVLVALFYGLLAAVFLGLSGFVYNKLAQRFGGVKLELDEVEK